MVDLRKAFADGAAVARGPVRDVSALSPRCLGGAGGPEGAALAGAAGALVDDQVAVVLHHGVGTGVVVGAGGPKCAALAGPPGVLVDDEVAVRLHQRIRARVAVAP